MNAYKKALVAAAMAGFVSNPVFAEEKKAEESNSSKVKVSDLKKEKKNDIDKEITNARMRANSGSKKKYSLSSTLSYTGGSIKDPFSKTRPDLYGPSGDPRTRITGSVSGRYRIDKRQSITAGVGFFIGTPFHGEATVKNNKTGKDVTYNQFDVKDTSLGYSYVAKVGRFQTSTSVDLGLGTSAASQKDDYLGGLSASYTALTSTLEGKLTLGAAISVGKEFYNRDLAVGKDVDSSVGLYPFAEYGITDSVSFRTVFGYFNYYQFKGVETKEWFNLYKSSNYQSVGIGIAATRDIYLYPNVQLNPDDISTEKTNVGISATINL